MKKKFRLRGRFNRVLSGKRVFTGKGIAVYATTRQGRMGRIGITCSRQIKGAVNRNRAKRRLRPFAATLIGNYDLVFIAQPASLTLPSTELAEETRKILEKLTQWQIQTSPRTIQKSPITTPSTTYRTPPGRAIRIT